MADRTSDRSSRAEQPADPADVQAVGYGPGDVVQVPERYADLQVHKEKSGRADRWNDDLMAPELLSVYVVDDRYLYATDTAGRVTHAEGWLGWLPSKQNDERRNVGAQRQAGEPDRQRTDDGGHLFGTSFDGPGEAVNLTAQSRTQNQAVKGSEQLGVGWRKAGRHSGRPASRSMPASTCATRMGLRVGRQPAPWSTDMTADDRRGVSSRRPAQSNRHGE